MKFFKLYEDTDPKVTGPYPQIQDLRIDYHEARGSQWAKIKEWKDESDYPDFQNFKLRRGAKLTDLVNSSFVISLSGLIISERAFRIISKHNIALAQHKPATIYRGDKPFSYVFLWYRAGLELIDLNKSAFHIYDTCEKVFGDRVPIESLAELKESGLKLLRETEHKELRPRLLCTDMQYDLGHFVYTGDLSCSENLKNAIESSGLTGFKFDEVDYEIISNS